MLIRRLCTLMLTVIVMLGPASATFAAPPEARVAKGPTRPAPARHRPPHHRPPPRPNPRPHRHVHVRVWRPHAWWHPIGFTLTVLATTAILVSVTDGSSGGDGNTAREGEGAEYYYDRGTFYRKEGDVFVVVKAPIGTVVPTLPEGCENTMSRGRSYYFYAGDFYADAEDGKYVVVEAPDGAMVNELPEGYEEQQKGETTYYVYNGVWYEPVTSGDEMSYVVTTL